LENLKESIQTTLGIHGRIILTADLRQIGWEVVDRMHLDQDRD